MTLEQILAKGAEIAVVCRAPRCGAVTPLNPSFFVTRYGETATLDQLAKRLHCVGCGSRAIRVEEWHDEPLDVRGAPRPEQGEGG